MSSLGITGKPWLPGITVHRWRKDSGRMFVHARVFHQLRDRTRLLITMSNEYDRKRWRTIGITRVSRIVRSCPGNWNNRNNFANVNFSNLENLKITFHSPRRWVLTWRDFEHYLLRRSRNSSFLEVPNFSRRLPWNFKCVHWTAVIVAIWMEGVVKRLPFSSSFTDLRAKMVARHRCAASLYHRTTKRL